MKKAQVILEVTVIFVIGLFLFFGIMGMWLWGDKQIAKRQPPYNDSRVMAGSLDPLDNDKPVFWPLTESVHDEASGYEYTSTYEIEPLSEEEVFGLQK